MALIREEKRFGIGPIGVARLSSPVPGSNAAGTIAESVARSADQMAEMFFRASAEKAEKFGTEQGSTVGRDQIIAIDPATGAPKAYQPPKGFGKIAQDAYQRVVMSRFQSSIEEEIKLKGMELAARYDGSVDRYSAAMSEYIGAMSENAEGQFKTYITDVGTSYLNATRTAMAVDQIRRERTAAAKAQEDSIKEGNLALRQIVAQSGVSGEAQDGAPTAAAVVGQSVKAAIDDGAAAEIFDPSTYGQLSADSRFAVTAGYVEYLARDLNGAAEANLLHTSITSGDLSLISDPNLRAMVGTLSYDQRKDLEKVSEDFVKDRADYFAVAEQIDAENLKANQTVAASRIGANAASSSNTIRQQASTYPLPAVVSVTSENFQSDTQYAAELRDAGRTVEADAILGRAKLHYESATNGLFNRAVLRASVEEANAMERAVRSGDISFAPANKQNEIAAIIALEGVSSVKDSFGSFVQSYKEDTGKALTTAKQDAEAFELSNLINQTAVQVTGQPAGVVNTAYGNAVSAISASKAKPEDKERLIKEAAANTAIAHLAPIFNTANQPTALQMGAMDAYINDGVDVGILTPTQMTALDEVRKYSEQADNRSEVTTRLGDYQKRTQIIMDQTEAARKEASAFSAISMGLGDGSDKATRETADKMFVSQHGFSAGELVSSPALLNDPANASARTALLNMPVLPQSAVNAFKTVMRSPTEGGTTSAILSAWRNMRDTSSSTTGGEIISPAVKAAFSEDEIAKLNLLDGVDIMSGGSLERIQDASRMFDLYKGNDAYRVKVEELIGGTIDEFVQTIEGADGLTPQEYQGIKGAALGLIGTSEISQLSVDGVRDRLEKQIERSAPNDGDVMNAYGGLNSSAALSITVGQNASMFRDYTVSSVLSSAYTPDGEKVSNVKLADLNALNVGKVVPGLGGFGSVSIPDDRSTNIFFRPMGPATEAGAVYTVMMWRPFGDGGPVALRQKVDLPNGGSIYPTMQVTTKDRGFVRSVEEQNLRRKAEAQAAVDARIRSDAEVAAGNVFSTPTTIDVGGWVTSLFGN